MISAAVTIYRAGIEQSLDKLIDFLRARLSSDLHELNVEALTHRKKSGESIQQKLQMGKLADVRQLRDLAGITIVLLYRSEIPRAIEILKASDLQIDDPGSIEVEPANFRYHEPKLFIRPPQAYLDRNDLAVDVCEVQFTTALQHALDKATHDFDYKGRKYSWSNFRLVAQMRGILEMVDRTIDGIEDVDLASDPTASPPNEMLAVQELIASLASVFAEAMPSDHRRFAETVWAWARACELTVQQLIDCVAQHEDLVHANSIDPTSAVLGALLRDHGEHLVANYVGRFFVPNELEVLCDEIKIVPRDRRVVEF